MMDRLGVALLAVPQTLGDSPPARQCLLRRRRDRLEALDANRADDR